MDVASLIGVVGILVAAILSSSGYLYRARLEGKKSYRRTLYFLLEIKYSISTSIFDPVEATGKYVDHLSEKFKSKGIPFEVDQLDPSILDMVKGHFINLIDTQKIDISSRLLEPYENSLLELSLVDPVLAYKLRGKDTLSKLLIHTKDYLETAKEELINPEGESWVKDLLSGISDTSKTEAYQELEELINSDILLLAKSCGRRDYKNTLKTFNTGIVGEGRYDFSDLDEYMDRVLGVLVEAVKTNHKQAESVAD